MLENEYDLRKRLFGLGLQVYVGVLLANALEGYRTRVDSNVFLFENALGLNLRSETRDLECHAKLVVALRQFLEVGIAYDLSEENDRLPYVVRSTIKLGKLSHEQDDALLAIIGRRRVPLMKNTPTRVTSIFSDAQH
jgi:hypothetical protein